MQTRMCLQPWTSLNILADGKVYPCCVLIDGLQIGDLNQETMLDVVNGEPSRRLKTKLLSGDIEDLPCAECPNASMGPTEAFANTLRARFGIPA